VLGAKSFLSPFLAVLLWFSFYLNEEKQLGLGMPMLLKTHLRETENMAQTYLMLLIGNHDEVAACYCVGHLKWMFPLK